jgi:hypothetical protein
MMPLSKDPGPRESDKYCSYCFRNGALTYPGNDLQVFQKASYDAMVGKGMNKWQAKFFTYLIKYAPRWKGAK